MGAPRSDPLSEIHFSCSSCGHGFTAAPERTVEAPERPWHPFAYFATCPLCLKEAGQVYWEQNLIKAHAHATGPRSEAGKAVSAANLAGHPTPEEARITRFNAMKHGLSAKVATFFPAKPGRYGRCTDCEHLATEACTSFRACLKQAELFLKFHAASENGDPTPLKELFGDTQAALHALMQDMIRCIVEDGGTRLKSPEWYSDKDGGFHLARYLDEESGELVQLEKYAAHPLLKPLMEFVAKNHTTLEDLALTPKHQEAEASVKGQLDEEQAQRESVLEYQRRQAEALEALQGQIERSRAKVKRDPVLVEYHAQEGEDG